MKHLKIRILNYKSCPLGVRLCTVRRSPGGRAVTDVRPWDERSLPSTLHAETVTSRACQPTLLTSLTPSAGHLAGKPSNKIFYLLYILHWEECGWSVAESDWEASDESYEGPDMMTSAPPNRGNFHPMMGKGISMMVLLTCQNFEYLYELINLWHR